MVRSTAKNGDVRPAVHAVVTQLAMGAYRQAFVDSLSLHRGRVEVRFLVGAQHLDPSLVTAVESPCVVCADRNRFFARRALAWQRGVVRESVGAEVAVVELNPRIVTAWLILAIRRVGSRPTLAWGHAWSRRGPGARTTPLRSAMRWLAHGVMMYTPEQADELRGVGPDRPLFVVHNALYREGDLVAVDRRPAMERRDVVVVGRLVLAKKPALALRAFDRLVARQPEVGTLHLVGVGPLEEELRAECASLGLDGRVRFWGQVDDPQRLGSIYASSFAALSPGYVGLSATQAVGFATPLVYGDNEPHAPELVLLNDGNSQAFESGSAESLATQLERLFIERERWLEAGDVDGDRLGPYTADRMAADFAHAIETVAERRRG